MCGCVLSVNVGGSAADNVGVNVGGSASFAGGMGKLKSQGKGCRTIPPPVREAESLFCLP